jgi:NAD(P)-dependent dehydrogenase (short-subunit alcohol dehydrogenase family)
MSATEAKVVIVTGAARGLGRAMALGLADSGSRVVAVCRPRAAGERPADAFPDAVMRVDADVTSEADCDRVVAEAIARFGAVDVVVNNAAIAHEPFLKFRDSDFADIRPDDWRSVFDVNVHGAFLMTRAAVPHLVGRGWGRVVNISTSMSTMLAPGVLPYGPSKAALVAMTVGWSRHLAPRGVTVNELLPGGPTGHRDQPKHWRAKDAVPWPAEMLVPPIRWLASSSSDGVSGYRFVATSWDSTLPDAEAAAKARFPAGWELRPHDYPVPASRV